jgi:hypothetical protein
VREGWADFARIPNRLPDRFDPAMVARLPEPASRFLKFAIGPGTPLSTKAENGMQGEIGLGTGWAQVLLVASKRSTLLAAQAVAQKSEEAFSNLGKTVIPDATALAASYR